MEICVHCLSVPRFPLFFKCGHLTCLPCLNKYYKLNFNCKFKVRCPTSKYFGSFDEIYTYKNERVEHIDSVSMKMFKEALFLCAHAGCINCEPWRYVISLYSNSLGTWGHQALTRGICHFYIY